jgi:serine acetyltransferase
MRPKSVAWSIYMVLSIFVSVTVASIPAIGLFLFFFQKTERVFAIIGWPFNLFKQFVQGLLGSILPSFFFEHFWFVLLMAPIGLFCYIIFLGFLLVMFRVSRRGIPRLKDGYYPIETGQWLLHEYYEIYYVLTPYFAWFFSVFLNTKPRHTWFGAKIGKNSIVGNGLLFNPERIVIGDNCWFGYNAIVSGHVYEGGRLYMKTVRIGNNVTVGANSCLMPGVDIGDNVIIGANTTIPKDRAVPADSVWVNGRATPRKPRTAEVDGSRVRVGRLKVQSTADADSQDEPDTGRVDENS